MGSENSDPVKYFLQTPDSPLNMNDLIGNEIRISFKNTINCISCGTITKTSFAQGYCYSCFISSPETEDCVLRPELCQAHIGISRNAEYDLNHCLIDHYVYMAVSGGLKVGVTRHTQKPTRWIDQGAGRAIIVAKTPNRYIAGCIEVALKKHFHDKTNWRKMLGSEDSEGINLKEEKKKALSLLHNDYQNFAFDVDEISSIHYPVLEYPSKIKSLSLDKMPDIGGLLSGIKGQYLIFKSGEVFNIRKHGGYLIELSY